MFTAAAPAFAASASSNLINNGGFEEVEEEVPVYWMRDMYERDGYSDLTVVREGADGGNCVRVENIGLNDARFIQVVNVEPETWYRVSGMVRAQAVPEYEYGANISILGSYVSLPTLRDTNGEWESYTVYFKTYKGQKAAELAVRLGGYSNVSTGVAWFDDIEMVKEDPPVGANSFELKEPTPYVPPAAINPIAKDATGRQKLWVLLPIFTAALLAVFFTKKNKYALPIIIAAALILRVWLAYTTQGYGVDINCFRAWAQRIASIGPGGFYAPDYFCDYPPGYILLLAPIGAILNSGTFSDSAVQMLVKIYPIIADLAIVWLLWKIGGNFSFKKNKGDGIGYVLALLYAFNPAVLVTGAWGQVDSILALGLLLTLWRVSKDDMVTAIPIFMATILIKPQAVLFVPMALAALLIHLHKQKWAKKAWERAGVGLLAGAVICYVIIFPFTIEHGWSFLPEKYLGTMNSYDYATVNAPNLYYLLGANWVETTTAIAGVSWLTFNVIAPILIAIAVAFCVYLYWKARDAKRIYLVGAMLFFLLFLFAYRMHERYLFPAIVLLLLAYARDRDGRLLILFGALSVTMFVNVWCVLMYEHMGGDMWVVNLGYALSAINLLLGAFAVWTAVDICLFNRTQLADILPDDANQAQGRIGLIRKNIEKRFSMDAPELRERVLGQSDYKTRYTRWDYITVCAITIAYGVVAFWGLGDTVAPQTWTTMKAREEIVLDLGKIQEFRVMYYCGIAPGDISFSTSLMGEVYDDEFMASVRENCFTWHYVVPSAVDSEGKRSYHDQFPQTFKARFIKITPELGNTMLFEVVPLDLEGNAIPIVSSTAAEIVDEQEMAPDAPSYMNGTYFDEIYHARTGFEYLHKMNPLETSHPPLGKVFIMLSIKAFGMTPFGWRFPGTLAGVLMIPAMYYFAMQLFKKTRWAAFAAMLLALDCMHLTQTRIATIDSYPVLFIILMYAFMARYFSMSFFRDGVKKTLFPLAMSGLMMSGAIASKWIGIYAAAGLAVIVFWSMIQRLREYMAAGRAQGDKEFAARAALYPRAMLITILWCVLWFIVVPLAVYILAYIPDITATSAFTLKRVWDAQTSMLWYHSQLVDTHAFKSKWYEWPLILKPMWFYNGNFEPAGYVSTILTFGNPAVWWSGFVGLVLVFRRWITKGSQDLLPRREFDGRSEKAALERRRDYVPSLLVIGFLAEFLPWVLVPRSTFIYHYFASTPFIMLCLVYCVMRTQRSASALSKVLQGVIITAAAILFIAFYPFATGVLMKREYANAMNWFSWLRLPGWPYTGWMFY
jgi:Gpi18-like mannosyltransferase